MTGPEHYREAEQLAEKAGAVMDADYGWMASLSSEERLQRRAAYLAEAQVHATLALAAATALAREIAGRTPIAEFEAWVAAAGELAEEPQS
jgi:hypothetical protein